LQVPRIQESLFRYLVVGVKDYAIFALDTSGRIASWNPGAERIKGYKAEEVIGKHFSIFYTEEANSQGHPDFELAQALATGSYEEEGWRIRRDGTHFRAKITISPLYDEQGKHLGFAKVTRDLSERQKATEKAAHSAAELEASESAFNLMIAAVKDYAIFSLSPEGIIQSWNAGAERIKGYTADEAIGKHFSIFYTQQDKDRKHPGYELEQAIKNGSYEEEGWRVCKDGQQIWASVTITPVRDASGVLRGFVKVTRDLTEHRRYESELEQARDEAVLANALKSKFVANVTHEIRTPLSGVVGLSELIAQDTNLDGQTREIGTRIFEASKQLLVILNDLLDFAKLEAGKIEVEHVPCDVAKVVDDVVGLAKALAEEKKLSISGTIDPRVPKNFVGDPNKLRQVLNNLVHNAIKFTETGGIEVFVEKQDETLFFSVVDTGIGIAAQTQDKLFKPFVQAHESTSRVFGGTGLGLSIARQLVELMGGTIGLVSDADRGTTIWFTLPTKSAVPGRVQ
jgi:PAS domain S-box-containing protein